jgi:hypothetical protein
MKGASLKMQAQWKSMSVFDKTINKILGKDTDMDGVPDKWDCQPWNPKRQDTKPTPPSPSIQQQRPSVINYTPQRQMPVPQPSNIMQQKPSPVPLPAVPNVTNRPQPLPNTPPQSSYVPKINTLSGAIMSPSLNASKPGYTFTIQPKMSGERPITYPRSETLSPTMSQIHSISPNIQIKNLPQQTVVTGTPLSVYPNLKNNYEERIMVVPLREFTSPKDYPIPHQQLGTSNESIVSLRTQLIPNPQRPLI